MTSHCGWYDRTGTPISPEQVEELSRDLGYKRVALTNITDATKSFRVSTVWLGLDHGFGDGPPIIFETMVFDNHDKCPDEFTMRRYATEVEAKAGHAEMVTVVRATLTDATVEDVV